VEYDYVGAVTEEDVSELAGYVNENGKTPLSGRYPLYLFIMQ